MKQHAFIILSAIYTILDGSKNTHFVMVMIKSFKGHGAVAAAAADVSSSAISRRRSSSCSFLALVRILEVVSKKWFQGCALILGQRRHSFARCWFLVALLVLQSDMVVTHSLVFCCQPATRLPIIPAKRRRHLGAQAS